jgi:DNA invertase Pin-like site-specific DNA recombinase
MTQLMGEPGPGSIAVGYVRYSSEMQDPTSIVTQKRVISEFADKKGWRIVRWYVEPEQSAKYEDVDERPVFAQMNEAYLRQLSKRTIDGKEDRARELYTRYS